MTDYTQLTDDELCRKVLELMGCHAMWLVGADATINEIEQYLEME